MVNTRYLLQQAYCPQCRRTFYAELSGSMRGQRIGLDATSVKSYFRSPGIPSRKIERIFEDVFGMRVTPTTVMGKEKKLCECGREIYEELKRRIRNSDRIKIDETLWTDDGVKKLLWCFEKGSSEGISGIGVLWGSWV